MVLSNGIEDLDFYTQWYNCNVQDAGINHVYFVDVYTFVQFGSSQWQAMRQHIEGLRKLSHESGKDEVGEV